MFSKIKAVGRRAATVAAGTVLVLSQCLGSFGAAFAPSTAYADTSTKTATVTLADTENGSLSFVGRDDDTKAITVNVGETVAIKASPADGYFADSLCDRLIELGYALADAARTVQFPECLIIAIVLLQALKNLPGLHPRMGGIGRCHRRHVILASHFPGNGVIDLESIQHHSYSLLSWCRNTNIPQ